MPALGDADRSRPNFPRESGQSVGVTPRQRVVSLKRELCYLRAAVFFPAQGIMYRKQMLTYQQTC